MSDRIIHDLSYGRCRQVSVDDVSKRVYPGWENLIKSMLDDMLNLGWTGELIQIKEKFGALRVYISGNTEAINDRIRRAEDESSRTCRECGAPGELRYGGWIKVLCDTHNKGKTH